MAVDADGFTVVCADGRFKITRVQPADGKKIEAGEWVKSASLATGTIFDKPDDMPAQVGTHEARECITRNARSDPQVSRGHWRGSPPSRG